MVKKSCILIVCCIAAAIICTATNADNEEKCSLPQAVAAALKALMPDAVIENSEMEEETVKLYEAKLKDGQKEYDIKLSEDGTLVEVESIETLDTVPAAVAETIKSQNAEIKKIEKAVEHAQIKVVKLEIPVTIYEAKIVKDGKAVEIKMNAEGKILNQENDEEKE
ncbi:MAG: hypothetical protein A2Y10_00885 [Planctomycetes bacterium GWF2_41_51]|nr:MAG: hypothetical protein A2Y10_00885 [Planctomycetes bacterium GWF2_41_51]HBG28111.1 hypothetical protein [Phycisphaerales bacterium]